MNTIKKIYCRAFQTAFKIALPFLPYRTPKGVGSLSDIPHILELYGFDRVIIITDKTIHKLGLIEPLKEALDANDMKYYIYDKTVANPTTDNVEEARKMYLANKCQAIISFGGGSPMDCAKGLGARIARPEKTLGQLKGILKVHKTIPLLIAIPTTAGTGSEATLAAVITDSVTRHKYAINDFPLIPRYTVLDPKVTLSLPPSITATTGLDALTHAVEAYIGNETTHGTRVDARMAVKLIFENLDLAYTDGTNVAARRNMLKASYYAGCAFTRSYVGYVHAISHSLSGEYNVPHGLANAVILPMMLEAYGETIYKKLHELAIEAGLATKSTSDEDAAKAFIQTIKDMKKRFGIGDTIPQIMKKDIPKLARYADKEANPLYPVPVLMDAKELEKYYHLLCEKK